MTMKNKFVDITGMWKRKKSVGNATEEHFYGQIREKNNPRGWR